MLSFTHNLVGLFSTLLVFFSTLSVSFSTCSPKAQLALYIEILAVHRIGRVQGVMGPCTFPFQSFFLELESLFFSLLIFFPTLCILFFNLGQPFSTLFNCFFGDLGSLAFNLLISFLTFVFLQPGATFFHSEPVIRARTLLSPAHAANRRLRMQSTVVCAHLRPSSAHTHAHTSNVDVRTRIVISGPASCASCCFGRCLHAFAAAVWLMVRGLMVTSATTTLPGGSNKSMETAPETAGGTWSTAGTATAAQCRRGCGCGEGRQFHAYIH